MLDDSLPVLGMANPHYHRGSNLSVRRGTRWLGTSHARLPLTDGGLSAPLRLTTRACRFDTLTDADLHDEHDPQCRTVTGLLAILRQHYAGFETTETVTLCRFEWTV